MVPDYKKGAVNENFMKNEKSLLNEERTNSLISSDAQEEDLNEKTEKEEEKNYFMKSLAEGKVRPVTSAKTRTFVGDHLATIELIYNEKMI
jgi:hypothetical protein